MGAKSTVSGTCNSIGSVLQASLCITVVTFTSVLFIISSSPQSVIALDLDLDSKSEKGKILLQAWKDESRGPRYSQCWTDALSNLDSGCKMMTDESQRRLALAFANCHLLKTGRETFPCDTESSIEDCTKEGVMSNEGFNIFSQFFTHTHHICHFLQNQVWQEATKKTIEDLSDNSAHVARQIEDSSALQNTLLEKQLNSLENQDLIMMQSKELESTLQTSQIDLHKMLEEFKISTHEQKDMIFEVFDRLSALQITVMGEFTGFYSVIFYVISIGISYLITSTPRTSVARFKLFMLMSLDIVIERLLIHLGSSDKMVINGIIQDSTDILYTRIWYCRKIFITLGIIVWLWEAYYYTDFDKENNKLLCNILSQNAELKQLLRTVSESPPRNLRQITNVDDVDQLVYPLNHNQYTVRTVEQQQSIENSSISTVTTGYESGSESDSSTDSTMTDHTFNMSEAGSEMSHLTTEDDRWSREGTPVLLNELKDLRSATPLKDYPESFFNSGLRGRSSNASTPRKQNGQVYSVSTVTHQYNLRQRKSSCNPILAHETADEFRKQVKKMQKTSMRNSQLTLEILTLHK